VAMVGTGSAVGPERAHEAAAAAIHCPLLEHIDLAMAKGMLVTITAGYSLTMTEFDEVGNTVRDCSDDDAQVVIGVRMDVAMEDELRGTIVATGLDDRFISAVGFDEIARRKEIICRWKLGELAMTDNSLYDYQDIPGFLLRPTI
jgi:cell division protein FtsZ